MRNIKQISMALLAALAVIVALQNTESVDTRILFVTFSMPRALLLIVVLLVGFVIGVLASRRMGKKPAEAA